MKKNLYEKPTTNLLVVRFRERILTVSPGSAGGNDTIVDDDTDY